MPLAFSFFTSKRSQAAMPADVSGAGSTAKGADFQGVNVSTLPEVEVSLPVPQSPFPVKATAEPVTGQFTMEPATSPDWGAAPTLILPAVQQAVEEVAGTVLPERRTQQRGLAALAVHQSEREAPPLNRRPITSPFPMTPVDLALTLMPAQEAPVPPYGVAAPAVAQPVDMGAPRPVSGPLAPDQDALRQQLQEEIEQVKNDLFGAVMGVSALKDRLDGLESQFSQRQMAAPQVTAAPATSRLEVESWVNSWMEAHLPAALERAFTASQERMMASLSTLAFFRTATPLSGTERQSFLAQPPVILTATPV